MKTYQIILFILLGCYSFEIKAQRPILQKDATIILNDQVFYTAGSDYQHWYYLPQGLNPKKDKEGVPQFLFMKYSGEGDSGAILHAIFDFRQNANNEQKTLKKLQAKVAAASSLQLYPFYHYFEDKESNQLDFNFIITDDKGKNELLVTSIQGQLNSSGAILSARLAGEVTDQIWESLQNPSQIVWLSTEISFPQMMPEKDIYVSLHLKKLAQFIQSKIGNEFTSEAFYNCLNTIKKDQAQLLTLRGRDIRSFSPAQQEERLNKKLVELLTVTELSRWEEKQQYERKSSKKVVIINGVVQKEETTESKSESKASGTEWMLRQPEELPDTALKYYLGPTTILEVPHSLQLNLTKLYNNESLSKNLFKNK